MNISEEECLRILETVYYSKGICCSYCRSPHIHSSSDSTRPFRHYCNVCKKSFSVTVGTPFHKVRKLSLWFEVLLMLVDENIDRDRLSSYAISTEIGVRRASIGHIKYQLTLALADEKEREALLAIVAALKPIGSLEMKKLVILLRDSLHIEGLSARDNLFFIVILLLYLKKKSNILVSSSQQLLANIEQEVNHLVPELLPIISLISQHHQLSMLDSSSNGSLLYYLRKVKDELYPLISNPRNTIDVLGLLYHQWIPSQAGDGHYNGVVLTPSHISIFLSDIASIQAESNVLDLCCGTGSLLLPALTKEARICGVEMNQDLYLLAKVNFILKDLPLHLFHSDCFDPAILETLEKYEFDIGLLNPPYSQKSNEELEFVEHLLSFIKKDGLAVVIVPMSCAIGTKFKKTRERLFTKHTLKAVFSMPNDLFYPTATNTCIMVWQAHQPHNSELKTFFGYFKDDGFVKRKNKGRVDAHNKWEAIKKKWLDVYRNSEVVEGLSAKQAVTHDMEWLCEAYMETDYSQLTQEMFEKTIKDYVAYKIITLP